MQAVSHAAGAVWPLSGREIQAIGKLSSLCNLGFGNCHPHESTIALTQLDAMSALSALTRLSMRGRERVCNCVLCHAAASCCWAVLHQQERASLLFVLLVQQHTDRRVLHVQTASRLLRRAASSWQLRYLDISYCGYELLDDTSDPDDPRPLAAVLADNCRRLQHLDAGGAFDPTKCNWWGPGRHTTTWLLSHLTIA